MHSDDNSALRSKEDQWSDLCDRWGAPEIETSLKSLGVSRVNLTEQVHVRMGMRLDVAIDESINSTMAVTMLDITRDDISTVDRLIYRHALDAAGDVIRSARFVCVDRRGDPVILEADEIAPGDALGEIVERALLRGHGAPREARDRMLGEVLLEIRAHQAAQLAQAVIAPAKKPSMMERVTRRMQRLKGCYATVVKGRT